MDNYTLPKRCNASIFIYDRPFRRIGYRIPIPDLDDDLINEIEDSETIPERAAAIQNVTEIMNQNDFQHEEPLIQILPNDDNSEQTIDIINEKDETIMKIAPTNTDQQADLVNILLESDKETRYEDLEDPVPTDSTSEDAEQSEDIDADRQQEHEEGQISKKRKIIREPHQPGDLLLVKFYKYPLWPAKYVGKDNRGISIVECLNVDGSKTLYKQAKKNLMPYNNKTIFEVLKSIKNQKTHDSLKEALEAFLLQYPEAAQQ